MKDFFTPATRRWIYGVMAAIIPLLITLGVITAEIGGSVLNIVAAALALGTSSMAYQNTDTTGVDE
jgi:hypothetical protein